MQTGQDEVSGMNAARHRTFEDKHSNHCDMVRARLARLFCLSKRKTSARSPFAFFSLVALATITFSSPAWGDLVSASKSFTPTTITAGTSSTISIDIVNSPPGNPNGITFTDTYPAGLTNTTIPVDISGNCGVAPTGTVGGNSVALSGGSISGNKICTISVTVTACIADSYTNPSFNVTSSSPMLTVPATTLTVTAGAVSAATSTVDASPTSVAADGTTTSTITVTLMDGCGNPVSGKTVTLTAGTGSSSISLASGTSNASGVVTFTVTDTVVEAVTYTARDTTTGTTITITQTATVTFTAVVASFNAVEPGADAGTGKIFTKIAGQNFALDIIALDASSAVSTGFTGAVAVEVVDNSSGGACSGLPLIAAFTNQTFIAGDAGRHPLSSPNTIVNVWKNAKVRIKYPTTSPNVTTCSTDNFAIRPSSFSSVSVTDSNWQTAGTDRTLANTAASGGLVHKAGQLFTISATAYNAAGTPAITSNYAGSPDIADLTACTGTACMAAFGAIALGTWAAEPGPGASGTVKTTTASYSEVGAFKLTLQDTTFANVDAADSSTAQRYISSGAIDVGRFVPDYFDVAVLIIPKLKTFNATNGVCGAGGRSFTYIGQPFGYVTLPEATIYARNAAGATTVNYKSALWKLVVADITQTYSNNGVGPALDTALIGTPTLTDNSNGTGTLAAAATGSLAYQRDTNTPAAPFNANLSLSVSAQDASENAANQGSISSTATALFNGTGTGIAFDGGGASNGKEFRYGRLKLSNAYGSELLNLPISIQTQYWDNTIPAFVTNSADNCTSLAAANITLGNYQGGINSTNMDNPAGTHISMGGVFAAGSGNLKLLKPTPAPSSRGSLVVTVDLAAESKTYLQGAWTGATYTQNPSAQAAFGVYKGAREFIYLRENY